MNFFLFDVVEKVFLQHDELPLHRVEHLEFDLVDLVPGLSVNEEVCVVEEGVHQQVGTVFYVEDLTS